MALFFAPLWLFMALPWLALAPAVAFATCFVVYRPWYPDVRSKLSILGPAFVWLAYAPYEWSMLQWSRTVVAPIRVDLLLIGPCLYAAVFFGVRAWLRARRVARGSRQSG